VHARKSRTGPLPVSVVVPVRNRRVLLEELLDALDAQTFRDFSVVVVDDGSTDGSAEAAGGRDVAGRPVQVVRQTCGGAVAARRAGVRAADGGVLAFTDSDCRPAPDWLAAGMAAVRAGADVVHGRTEPLRPLRPLERSVHAGDEGLFATCNIFYRRATFDAAGGFDPDAAARLGFRPDARARGLGFGEDTLLGWRAVRMGADVRYAPEAVVHHHVSRPRFAESASRCWMAGAFPALLRAVPELRRTMIRRGVLLGRSRIPAYATLAAVLARRPLATAGAAVWWATSRYRELGGAQVPATERLAAVPVEMALDVVTGSALLVGSARSRTVVL
jgi:glycosyltransferase involved in cell wall biosynthesis